MEVLVNEPKTKRGKITFEKICNAANEVFHSKGYYEASIVDITTLADVAVGTFYVYFNDKLTLYKYLLIRYSKEIRRYIRNATINCKNRKEEEREGTKAFLLYIKEKPQSYNIIWNSLYIDKELFKNYYEDFCGRYSVGISSAQERDEMVENDVVLMSYMLMGIVNFVGLKYVLFDNSDNDDEFDELVDNMMMLIENGFFV